MVLGPAVHSKYYRCCSVSNTRVVQHYAIYFCSLTGDLFHNVSLVDWVDKRDEINSVRPQSAEATTAMTSATKTECLIAIEPRAAPANMAVTAAIRRNQRGLFPRASEESA